MYRCGWCWCDLRYCWCGMTWGECIASKLAWRCPVLCHATLAVLRCTAQNICYAVACWVMWKLITMCCMLAATNTLQAYQLLTHHDCRCCCRCCLRRSSSTLLRQCTGVRARGVVWWCHQRTTLQSTVTECPVYTTRHSCVLAQSVEMSIAQHKVLVLVWCSPYEVV